MTRVLKSYRLAPGAVDALDRLADDLGLSHSRAFEWLVTGEIAPRRLSSQDLAGRRVPARIEEIRQLVRLARELAKFVAPNATTASSIASEVKTLIQHIYQVIERVDALRGRGRTS